MFYCCEVDTVQKDGTDQKGWNDMRRKKGKKTGKKRTRQWEINRIREKDKEMQEKVEKRERRGKEKKKGS